MFLGKLIGREIAQTLMRPLSIVKVDPGFCGPQKVAQGLIGPPLSDRQLEDAHKAFGIAIVRWSASPAHGELKALLYERRPCQLRSILAALIGVPDHVGNRET